MPGKVFDLDARKFSPLKIIATMHAARELGVPIARLLSGSGLTQSRLLDPATMMSMNQYLGVTNNFLALSNAPDAALTVGRHLHVSSYGMLGYAMMCQPTLRQVFALAVQYHRLAAPMIPLRWEEREGLAIWCLPVKGQPTYMPLNPIQFDYFIDLQCMILAVSTQDIMGPECRYEHIRLARSKPTHPSAWEDALGCSVEFDCRVNELEMQLQWLDRAPRLSNLATAAQMSVTCAELLQKLQIQTSVAQQVYYALTQVPGHYPTMEDVALGLGMTSRTLRRKLTDEGTSFQALLAQVREALARDYLVSSHLSVEDIANTLGFSDATAFRHAFKRWTGGTPLDFRLKGIAGSN